VAASVVQSHTMMHRVLVLLALVAPAAPLCAQPTVPMAFAFVLLGEGSDGQPVPMVRTVVEGDTSCPVLRDRAGATLSALAPRQRPDGGQFDQVMVCEARYPVGQPGNVQIAGLSIDLPVVARDTPRRIVLLGDSGCRGQAERKPQSCVGDGSDRMWPFGPISMEGAHDQPDLIVHVGDYN
jgi:hypothetical protein